MADLNYRYCARILIETVVPLKIGTGKAGLNIDEQVAIDANGLPTIPGTAICGVIRHSFDHNIAKKLFGYQEGKDGKGSRLIFSEARFVGQDGQVLDGCCKIDYSDKFYSKFKKLAIRDHCKINYRGVTDKAQHGKFDSQVVFKGTRFVFDIELIGNKKDDDNWKNVISLLHSSLFRIGGGTRKGFGELKVVAKDVNIYNLDNTEDLRNYLNKSSKLNIPVGKSDTDVIPDNIAIYKLKLQPDDFFLFSSGYGDDEVDAIPKKESYINWKNQKPYFSEKKVLIPATSVKGVISHRTAFHYNRLTEKYIDKVDNIEDFIGENNNAVKELFGFAKDSKKDINNNKQHGQRGRVFFSDVFLENTEEKILNHVAIDRFTGGAMNGALFDEKGVHTKEEIILKIIVDKDAFKQDHIQDAFECTLKDITTGMLPLGGSTMHGHGCFSGELIKI